jgi:hypothetical protein
VLVSAAVSKNTNGIVYWLMIPIMIAKAFLWIGFCFPVVVCAVATQFKQLHYF